MILEGVGGSERVQSQIALKLVKLRRKVNQSQSVHSTNYGLCKN